MARIAVLAGLLILAGCTGLTAVELGEQPEPYRLTLKTDPATLKPPQLATLTYGVFDTQTDRPVTAFQHVAGALIHNILIHRDLQFFRHSYTQNLVRNEASMLTYFPRTGTYYAYTLFHPADGTPKVSRVTITTGPPTEEHDVQLVEDRTLSKVSAGVRVQLVKGEESYRANQPSQLLFHVTEGGRPVEWLGPLFGAPGHLWIVNEEGEDFTHVMGAAEARRNTLGGTPGTEGTPGTPAAEGSPTTTVTAIATPAQDRSGGVNIGSETTGDAPTHGEIAISPMPTLVPGVRDALASVTAVPQPTLFPVQQTAQASVLEPPAVLPAISFGPDIIFTHTFPHAGLYKMWLELHYRDLTITTDFVVRVVE